MPTLFIIFGIRFYFFANDHMPIHVHLQNADGEAKFQVSPKIVLIENKGLKNKDLKLAESIIEENKEIIIQKWNEFFSK